jgi:hypothetical protein
MYPVEEENFAEQEAWHFQLEKWEEECNNQEQLNVSFVM